MAERHRVRLLMLLLFSAIFYTSDSNATETEIIPGCPSSSCGDVIIDYPFWVRNQSAGADGYGAPTYCGYEGLEINCSDTTTPYFRTSTDRYLVKSLNTGTKTITLADADAMGSSCPRVTHNVNISAVPFLTYPSTVTKLTFFFNCSSVDLPEAQKVGCLKDKAGPSYVLKDPVSSESLGKMSSWCAGGFVVAPVLSSGLQGGNDLAAVFEKALKTGFELRWGDPQRSDCLRCEESGGRCGYSNTTGHGLDFLCFCKDGQRSGPSANCGETSRAAAGVWLFPRFFSFLIINQSLYF